MELHEEIDEDAGGVMGLEGDYNLYGAIAVFGGVDFEACFDRDGWQFKPEDKYLQHMFGPTA